MIVTYQRISNYCGVIQPQIDQSKREDHGFNNRALRANFTRRT